MTGTLNTVWFGCVRSDLTLLGGEYDTGREKNVYQAKGDLIKHQALVKKSPCSKGFPFKALE